MAHLIEFHFNKMPETFEFVLLNLSVTEKPESSGYSVVYYKDTLPAWNAIGWGDMASLRLRGLSIPPASFWRHPLTLTVVGFALTGIFGSWFAGWIDDRRRESERYLVERRIDYEAGIQAIRDFALVAHERREWAVLLASAIRRNATLPEITERKAKYDVAYVEWSKRHQADLLVIRGAIGERSATDFEEAVELRLVNLLRKVDACVTSAYDLALAQREVNGPKGLDRAQRALDQCDTTFLMTNAWDCIVTVTNELYQLMAVHRESKVKTMGEYKADALWAVHAKCPNVRVDPLHDAQL